MSYYVGWDPGKSGALVMLNADGSYDQSFLLKDGWGIHPSAFMQGVRHCVEKVHAMPGQGVTSMFSFGMSYGGILAILELKESPHTLVTPQAWKKEILKGLNYKGDKKIAAEWLFREHPEAKEVCIPPRCRVPNMGLVDAWCIAEYGRRHWRR